MTTHSMTTKLVHVSAKAKLDTHTATKTITMFGKIYTRLKEVCVNELKHLDENGAALIFTSDLLEDGKGIIYDLKIAGTSSSTGNTWDDKILDKFMETACLRRIMLLIIVCKFHRLSIFTVTTEDMMLALQSKKQTVQFGDMNRTKADMLLRAFSDIGRDKEMLGGKKDDGSIFTHCTCPVLWYNPLANTQFLAFRDQLGESARATCNSAKRVTSSSVLVLSIAYLLFRLFEVVDINKGHVLDELMTSKDADTRKLKAVQRKINDQKNAAGKIAKDKRDAKKAAADPDAMAEAVAEPETVKKNAKAKGRVTKKVAKDKPKGKRKATLNEKLIDEALQDAGASTSASAPVKAMLKHRMARAEIIRISQLLIILLQLASQIMRVAELPGITPTSYTEDLGVGYRKFPVIVRSFFPVGFFKPSTHILSHKFLSKHLQVKIISKMDTKPGCATALSLPHMLELAFGFLLRLAPEKLFSMVHNPDALLLFTMHQDGSINMDPVKGQMDTTTVDKWLANHIPPFARKGRWISGYGPRSGHAVGMVSVGALDSAESEMFKKWTGHIPTSDQLLAYSESQARCMAYCDDDPEATQWTAAYIMQVMRAVWSA